MGGGSEEREQTLNQLLVEMDGFEQTTNVIVLAATNRADVLDPALLRPGRFDRQVVVDLPDLTGRLAILQVHAHAKPLAPDIDLAVIARQTPGFAGADLANLLNEGALLAARRHAGRITRDDLQAATERVALGPKRRGRVLSAHEKAVTAYHEAGHALVARLLATADPVHKITIIGHGRAGGIPSCCRTTSITSGPSPSFLTRLPGRWEDRRRTKWSRRSAGHGEARRSELGWS